MVFKWIGLASLGAVIVFAMLAVADDGLARDLASRGLTAINHAIDHLQHFWRETLPVWVRRALA